MTAVQGANTSQSLWQNMPGWGIVANLTPPELLQARRAAAVRRLAVAVLALIVLVAGGLYGWQIWRSHTASEALANQHVTASALTAQQGKYAEVVQIKGTISQVDSQLAGLMTNDTALPQLVAQIRADAVPGMTLTQLSAYITAGSTSPASATSQTNTGAALDTTGDVPVGVLTLTGTAVHFADVATYVLRLGTVPGVAAVYPTNNARSVTSSAGTQFTLQMTVTAKALTHRFDHLGGTN